jgi:hypothetical protein
LPNCWRVPPIDPSVVNCFPIAPFDENGPPTFSPICPIDPSAGFLVSNCFLALLDYNVPVNCLPIEPSALNTPAPVSTGFVACSGTPVDPKSSFLSPLIHVNYLFTILYTSTYAEAPFSMVSFAESPIIVRLVWIVWN